jgi:hypothetical protein
MADTILTLAQIEDFFQVLTCAALGIPLWDNTDPLNPVPINQDKVRIAWPADGQPGWPISADIAFIRVTNVDDEFTRLRNVQQSASNRSVTYYTNHLVSWVFYGPNSYDHAETLRNSLYSPGMVSLMTAQNLAMIPEFESIMRAPELFNGQWFPRVDWQAKFQERIIRNDTVPTLISADIKIYDEQGEVKEIDCNITP